MTDSSTNSSGVASANSPLYAGRRRRNAIAKGLALAATLFGLGWLVLILGILIYVLFFLLGKKFASWEA